MDPLVNQINTLLSQIYSLQEELEVSDEIIESLLEEYDSEETLTEEKKKWIQDAIKKPGALRKSLKAKEGKNIPRAKLETAAKKSGKTGARARLALKLRSFKK
jgi:endonuclease III